MVMTFEKRSSTEPRMATRTVHGEDDPGRAVAAALLSDRPATFTIEADSVHAVTEFASPVRQFLLMMGRLSGGVSATVAPHFAEETYPALLQLVGKLDDSGASDLWRPDGGRTLAVGEARHIFISADMPLAERTARPDRMLEVVAAHRITNSWYRSRVAPRLVTDSLVRVFYGRRGVAGSAFAVAEAEAMVEEGLSGERRRFSLRSAIAARVSTLGTAV